MMRLRRIFIAAMVVFMMAAFMPQKAEAAGLSKEAYCIVKGQWWYQSSSGGCDARFTRKVIRYYNRKNYQLARTASIQMCVKKKDGYHIRVKDGKVHYWYIFPLEGRKKKEYQLWFRFKEEGEWNYSGSSSLNRGKWRDRLS